MDPIRPACAVTRRSTWARIVVERVRREPDRGGADDHRAGSRWLAQRSVCAATAPGCGPLRRHAASSRLGHLRSGARSSIRDFDALRPKPGSPGQRSAATSFRAAARRAVPRRPPSARRPAPIAASRSTRRPNQSNVRAGRRLAAPPWPAACGRSATSAEPATPRPARQPAAPTARADRSPTRGTRRTLARWRSTSAARSGGSAPSTYAITSSRSNEWVGFIGRSPAVWARRGVSFSASRARNRRDRTVPTGRPNSAAISS